ncbi:MAG: BatA domain-containing protein [Planctomycetaceae bacterium]
MLSLLTLTTPLLLGGLSLLALPLIAHWLHRRSQRTLVFPSIALLLEVVAQQSQFQRLKRWLLLLLRLVAVACIVLAFTRPVWQTSNAKGAMSANASAAVVAILDVSLSTGQQAGGPSDLEQLKGQLGIILDGLEPGLDLAGVVPADGTPRGLYPQLTANLGGLRSQIQQLQPGYERADFVAALAVAGKLLGNHAGPRRLVILSDLQRTNWSELLAMDNLRELLPADTELQVVGSSGKPPDNVALSWPRHFPSLPLAGEPVDLSVHVVNYSAAIHQVRILCEGQSSAVAATADRLDPVTVPLGPREEREVTFRLSELSADRSATRFVTTADDGLLMDNEAWLSVESTARTAVIVLSDDDPSTPGSAAYYLSRALAPTEEDKSRFAPQSMQPAEISRQALARAKVVVIGYTGDLTESAAAALVDFVRAGGGLVIFSGEGPVDRNLQRLDKTAGVGTFLPWTPGPSRLASGGRDEQHLGNGRWHSRWLRSFDEQSQYALQQIHFDRTWTAGALSSATDVLLGFSDGSPAVGTRPFGNGVVAVANFSPESTTSDLARHGAFVALTQSLVQGATLQGTDHEQPNVGESWTWPHRFTAAEAEGLTVTGPDDQPVALTSRLSGHEVSLSLARLARPGLYRLQRGSQTLHSVAVGLDPRESDLQRIRAQDLERHLQLAGADVIAGVNSPAGETLRGRPLWGEFLTAALAAIGLELFLLGWWRR